MNAAIFVLLVAIFSYNLGNFLLSIGLNKRVYNHVPGECSSVRSFEDGVTDFDTSYDGTVFMSAGRCEGDCGEDSIGRILTYNVDNKSAWQMTITGSKLVLNPGGISLSSSRKRPHLMVVNHGKKRTVETFSYDREKHSLKHLRTIKSRLFSDLADVAAVDGKKFFATSHTYSKNMYAQMVEKMAGFPTGSLLFFDGEQTKFLAAMSTPAALVYDRFRSLLFVASTFTDSIRVFDVSPDFNVTLNQDIPLKCSPSSLWRDIDNSLVAACHPVKLRYLTHMWNSTNYFAPTQILKVHFRSNKTVESPISQLYSNDGATVSAASAAVRSGKTLLIGSTTGMLSCDLSIMA